MTGYGRATGTIGPHSLTVQITSVNRRSLDLTVALPDAWESLEPAILEAVRRAVLRGKVHVTVEVNGAAGAPDWDTQAINATLDQLADLARARGIRFDPTAELLWQVASAQRSGTSLPAVETAAAPVLQVVQKALRELGVMRAKEGETLLVDFLRRMETLRGYVETVAGRAPAVTAGYREVLLQRLRTAGLALDVADERVLKEVALFADRCDITEEITRLRSHFAQLGEHLRHDGEVGRKAEFILQEVGREVHTIGSKANDLVISQSVIEFKNELERIREQMANVE
ncbi:MAG: YicC/YloC family endoribonuclease [Opitutales bacterium]